ncbi:MAG: endo-1,4-beta-xylanase, partial [Bacteroidales bacterium]
NTVGDSILWNCFKWARSADPDAELYINDYNVEYNWGQAEEYRDLILEIKNNGGPVTGVGIQAHFWDCCRPNVDELVSNLNIIAEAGLPMRLTEYDWGTDLNQEQQVADYIKVLTVAFSHPSVNGMICWGLSDDGAWRENTGFFDSIQRPKLAADTLLYYTKTKWATNFDSDFSDSDTLAFNAYYGDYEIEVMFNDTVKVFTVPLLEAYADSVFTLYEADAALKGPELLSAELDGEDMVKLTFDKSIEPSSIKPSDFKFFSSYEIGINDIQVDPDNSSELQMALSAAVTAGDYVSVSYFPGDLAGTDSSLVNAFGPEGLYNPGLESGKIFTITADNFIKVYPNPASDIINIVCDSAPFRVKLINSLGAEVYSGSSSSNELQIDVNKFKSGIYFMNVVDTEHNMNIQKIMLK